MKSIGFIGLGVMGEPMAANLLRKGYSVTVYNRSPGKEEELVKLGADVAGTPAEATRDADIVITMVSNDAAIEDIYYGVDGIIGALKPGTIVIDSSTISPKLSRKLAASIRERFSDFIDAPVTGSKPAAIEGTLLFMAGGEPQVVEAHRELLLAMGREVVYVGPSGSGSNAKLAHNTIVGINAAGLIEGMAIAAQAGIDASAFLRIVQAGGAASKQADLKGRKIIDRDFSVQFSLNLMLKDLRLSSELTDGIGVPSPMLGAAKSLFQVGQAAALGDYDLAALSQVYEGWIGKLIADIPAAADETAAAAVEAGSGSERRKKTRLPLSIPVMMSIYQWQDAGGFSGQSVEGTLLDVSEDGVLIRSTFPLEQDMFVVIHFQEASELPPMTAKVIRIKRKDGQFEYGCLLAGLPLYQRLQLKAYIEGHRE